MIPIPLPVRPSPRRVLALALLGAALAVPHAAQANTVCGAVSPALERLGADYLLLGEGTRLATDGLEPLERFLAGASGSRRLHARRLAHLSSTLQAASLDGLDGERVRCRGAGATLRAVRWRFDLEQLERVQRLDGLTVLTAIEARHDIVTDRRGDAFGDDRLVAGTRVAEVLDVPPPNLWRAGTDGRTLRASRRFRRAESGRCPLALGANGCSYLTEIDTTARAVGRTIEIEQVFYVQGRLSERVLWRLGT